MIVLMPVSRFGLLIGFPCKLLPFSRELDEHSLCFAGALGSVMLGLLRLRSIALRPLKGWELR